MNPLQVGQVIHGFAGGAFGRDSYACRRVEAIGVDWVVTRNWAGWPEFTTRLDGLSEAANDWSYCTEDCTGGRR